MFETAVQQQDPGTVWKIVAACVAFAVLVAVGYMLIA
jgi:hypothetical protein